MSGINKQRLLNVVRALRESKNPEDFDMGTFAHRCGTPGCALGHYAARRDLQDAFELEDFESRGLWYTDAAVRKHFNIDFEQATELFAAEGCGDAVTAKQAARYIEDFVARDGE